MNRPRIIAAGITIVVAALIVLLLNVWHLSLKEYIREWPPRHTSEIALDPQPEEDLYFDVLTPTEALRAENPAPAQLPEPANNLSNPAPKTGHDTYDRGAQGDAPTVVTSKQPAPVKQKTEPAPAKTGPSKEELERQRAQEEIRRRASSSTATAFQRSQGQNNTANTGKTPGDSGTPNGSSASTNGTGTGTVGGGWKMPRYAAVPSTVTGSIKLTLTVDREGRPHNITVTGGDPPAATDARLLAAVKAEVASRRFSRPNSADAPDQATAYITYRFR